MLGKLLRFFGYVFSGGLSVALIALALAALLLGANTFTLDLIPWWTGRELAMRVLAAGVFGLLATALAVTGRLPFLQLLWTMLVLGTLVYGFYVSSYKYDDWDHFRSSLNYTGMAVLAFIAAVTGLFARKARTA